MDSKKIKISLIVRDRESNEFYNGLLSRFEELRLETYRNISQFKESSKAKDFEGIIIDLRTLIEASTDEKAFFFKIRDGFPVLNVSWAIDKNIFHCFIESKKMPSLKGEKLLEYFVKVCLKNNKKNYCLI